MTKHHKDYLWKHGLPYGIQAIPSEQTLSGVSYKIVSDPYHKRNSIEKYVDGNFSQVIYDSAVFDFRHLKPALQTAWQKTTIYESNDRICCHIRDHDDRLILIEDYSFENNLCLSCHASSPSGILISVQKISYKELGDPFDGVSLYDSNQHPVLVKKYSLDGDRNFSDLLSENWEMTPSHI